MNPVNSMVSKGSEEGSESLAHSNGADEAPFELVAQVNGVGEEPTGSGQDHEGARKAPGVHKSAGAVEKGQRSRKRSRDRIEELKRIQDGLLAPEKKTEPVGTRLEPSLHARWEAAAKVAGVSSSALVYVAAVEYLESAEQRSIAAQIQDAARLVAETGSAVLGANEEARFRMESLETLVARLTETIATQESRFVTVDDLRELLSQAESDDEGADESIDTGGDR